jgi:hypothetical protein
MMVGPQQEGGSKSMKTNTMKIGVDLFVNLKKGSISKYYTIG